MSTTRTTVWPLDVAFGCGLEVQANGRTWIFSPLTFKDWGDVIARARSEALGAYLDAAGERKGIDHRQRAIDINAILFGTQAQQSLEMLRAPELRRFVLRRSLEKKHPDVTDDDVNKFLEDEHQARMYSDIIELLSLGPQRSEQDGDENPTSTNGSTSIEKSPDSQPVSDGGSKTLES